MENKLSIRQSNTNKDIISYKSISRKGLEKLDFLLLLIESLEINGTHSLIITSRNLGMEKEISDPVDLWKTRVHNPLRKTSRRGNLSVTQIQSLVKLISVTSDRLYPLIRQLLSKREPVEITEKRWFLLSSRFMDLISERMNMKRTIIQKLLSKQENMIFLKELVLLLALSSGPDGVLRLTNNLCDIN